MNNQVTRWRAPKHRRAIKGGYGFIIILFKKNGTAIKSDIYHNMQNISLYTILLFRVNLSEYITNPIRYMHLKRNLTHVFIYLFKYLFIAFICPG